MRIKIDKERFWLLVEKNESLNPVYTEGERTGKFDVRVVEQTGRDVELEVDEDIVTLFDNHLNRLRIK